MKLSEVFLSYKRDDLARARHIVAALRGAGISVWWDQDIAPGQPWEASIERELSSSKVVIVAWSPAAVESENVKAEARSARADGKLIQVFVETCNPPLFFGERQGVDLSGWTGDPNDRRFQIVLDAVRAILEGRAPAASVGFVRKKRPAWGLLATAFALISSLVGLAANLGGARDAACGLSALHATCERAGLLPASASIVIPDAGQSAAPARAALFAKVEGDWGNVGQDGTSSCTTSLHYSVEKRGAEDFIIVRGAQGFESVARVAGAEASSIFTRTVTPVEQAGAQWELRLEADRLIHVDAANVGTTLVRCAE